MGDIIDRFSECIALTMDIGRSGYHRSSFLFNAVADRELGPCSVAVPKLEHWGHRWDSVSALNVHQTRANDSYYNYFRYWHGYTVVTRPMLALVGVRALRILVAILLGTAFVAFLVVMAVRARWWIAILMGVCLLLTVDFYDLPGSITHGLSTAVAFGCAALVLFRVKSGGGWVLWPLVAGSIFCFFDTVINPPVAWVLCTFGVALVVLVEGGRALRASAAAAASWMVGYGGTWVSKWSIDTVFFGWHAVHKQIADEIGKRSGGSDGPWQVIAHTLNSWLGNGEPILGTSYSAPVFRLVVVLLGIIVTIAMLVVGRRLRQAVVLMWPALLVPLWFSTFREHTYLHSWFTYRSLPMAFAVLVTGSVSAPFVTPKRTPSPTSPRRASTISSGAEGGLVHEEQDLMIQRQPPEASEFAQQANRSLVNDRR
jgi:hypothetical protein